MAEDKELCDGLTNKPTRVRRYHTRSRTGCSSCRSRRKRCGEQRPVCDSCVSSGRVCSYEPAQLPLRERRAHQKEVQPWDQKPSWQVQKPSQQTTFHKATPIPAPLGYVSYDTGYNRLACEMPLRSHELFHYLLNSAQGPKNGMNVSNTNGLTRLTDDPFGLRSTLLLAGMHFCFQYGNLEPFESTFFYHRVQVIKYINKWISNGSPKPDPRIIRQMVTLSFTELCNGQILLAEAHVSGILAIIESKNRAKGEELFAIRPRSTDEELTNRYFIMAYTYICGLKSLLIGICRHGKSGSSLKDYTGKELVQMSYIWHKAEALESWISKLEGIREIPSFLTPLPHGATLNNADAYNLIQPLRRFTAGIDRLSTGVQSADDDFDTFWRLGSASRMLGAFVRTHLESISVRKGNSELRRSQSDSFEAPWGAVVTAFVIYAQTILCVIEPVEPRMHKYTVTLFHHDMALYFSESRTPHNPAFILWLLVMGLVGCHTSSRDDEDLTIHPSTSFFQTAVRQQSKEMGISCWSQAIKALTEVTWPTTCDRSGFIQELWESSVSTES